MKQTGRFFTRMIILMMVLTLAACGGMPEKNRKRAEKVDGYINKTQQQIANMQAVYQKTISNGGDAKFFAPYAANEKWSQNFTDASSSIKRARTIYNGSVKLLLDRNKKEEVGQLNAKLKAINVELSNALAKAKEPVERQKFLLDMRKNAPQILERTQAQMVEARKLFDVAGKKNEQVKVDTKKFGWNKTDQDLDKVFAPLQIEIEKGEAALLVVENEFAAKTDINYAQFGDNARMVENTLNWIKTEQPKYLSKLDELYRDYTKKIVDRKVEYYVVIGRVSWDEDSDFASEHTVNFTRQVTEEVFNHFDAKDSVATYNWWSKLDLASGINQAYWNALKINPKEQWPDSSDDHAEFWVENAYSKQWEKYEITENGDVKETDWIPVTEAQFWVNDGANMGMVVASKPYGFFESETSKVATPPGMDRIAKPTVAADGSVTGSNQYGKWEPDPDTGKYFWNSFAGAAAGNIAANALFGGNRYSYDEWYDWDTHYRGKKPYYGSGDNDRYGTYGYWMYRDGSRYNKSHYASRNPKAVSSARSSRVSHVGRTSTRPTGGTRLAQGTVRGAGASSRGRGPSGGGK